MLCFILKDGARRIELAIDEAGMQTLTAAFERARAQGHAHLLGASCGGKELDETSPSGEACVCEVILSDASAG